MAKGGKMFDAIMIVIIMITIMNYADYIKVDTKLMMVLLSIALYVTAKNMQKSKNQNTNKKVEPLEGSTVAFDKEAFVNLNKIVNELVKQDSVTIPGNLIVKGTTTMENDLIVKGTTTMEKDLNVHTSVNVGTDDNNAMRIRQNRIGTKACGELEFRDDGWVRHFTYGTGDYRSGCGFAASTLYSRDNIGNEGTLTVNGATVLKGTLNAHGQVECNNTLIGGLTVAGTSTLKGALTVAGTTTCNGQFRSEGEGVFRNANGHYSHINHPSGICIIRGDIKLDGYGGSGTSVLASGFKNKDNGEEGMFFDQGLRLQANGNNQISLHTCTGRNSTRSTRYVFDGTAADNVDNYGNIYQSLSDGHGRWMGEIWSKFQR